MAESISLLDFLLRLINDEELRQDFNENPDEVLEAYNLNDLSAQDVYDALVLAQDSHQASFDRNYDTGSNYVPPVPAHAGNGGHDGGQSHKEAVEYINKYITNNYVDDRDTIVDNSINQNIDNRGGIFNQDIDVDSVVASGDGAVAAGDDIENSTITTGNGNVVGDGNDIVKGDGNTTAFGNGNAVSTGDLTTGNGGAISFGGTATGNDADSSTDVRNFGDGDTNVATAANGSTANQTNTNNENNSTNTTDSNNETNVNVEDSFNTDTDIDFASNNEILSDNTSTTTNNDNDLLDLG